MKGLLITVSISSTLLMSGCAPVAFMGGATTVATSASEERGMKGVFSDTKIKAQIQALWMDKRPELIMATTLVVRQGRVLITGELDSTEHQIDAVRYAWQVPGVKEVVDETTVGRTSSFQQYARDSWITTQLKTKLLNDNAIRSLNYNIHTENGVIYLMGIAQNQQELDTVIDYARHVGGARKVTSYVTLKSSPSKQGSSHPQAIEPYHEPSEVKAQPLDEPNTGSSFQ